MKVLIVFNTRNADNLFVHTLAQGIVREGAEVVCSTELFWTDNNTHYDIIHFQWPEELAGWSVQEKGITGRLQARIEYWKVQGSRFVYTRHNVRPHYANEITAQVYKIIEEAANTVVHMGRFSYNDFQSSYPQSNNVIIPHPIYEQTYREDISQIEARKHLSIPEGKFVVVAFGKFRNNKEVKMVVGAFMKLNIPQKMLLAPRLLPFNAKPGYTSSTKRWTAKILYWTMMQLARICRIRAGGNEEVISNEDLPYYLAASDVVMVQRIQILNSGNVPLAFLFHKVVIGPKEGNVYELLQQTKNPVFDGKQIKTVTNALKQAYTLCQSGQGERNYQYALREMGIGKVSREYLAAYQQTLNKK